MAPESSCSTQVRMNDLNGQMLGSATWQGSGGSPPLILNSIGATLDLLQPFVTARADGGVFIADGSLAVPLFDVVGVGRQVAFAPRL